MTDQRLAEIQNRRLDEVTPGPWLVSEDQDGNALVYVERQSPEGKTYASVLLAADWATEADVQFVASARRSVPELLAEVARLRGIEANARKLIARLNQAAETWAPLSSPENSEDFLHYRALCSAYCEAADSLHNVLEGFDPDESWSERSNSLAKGGAS
jgi:hypothetical protein